MSRPPSWLPWLALAAVVVGLTLAGDAVTRALRYEREAVLAGQLWRLLTAGWVHLGTVHAALNAAALVLIPLALGGGRFAAALCGLLACQLGVGAGLLLFSPWVEWYVGLSGALHGFVLLMAAAGGSRLILAAACAGVAVKLGWELGFGASSSLEAMIGGPVVVLAHVYGAGAGALLLAAGTAARVTGRRGTRWPPD